MTPILELTGIGKRFGAFQAVQDIAFSVAPGETLGLIGPNGAGKTTLFNIITGFLRSDRGNVRFDGQPMDKLTPDRRVALGLVRTFQKAMVFPALTARENIAMAARQGSGHGLRWFGARRAQAEAEARAETLLSQGGLSHRAGERIGDLSYGEQRMVDLLISLSLSPRLLLLDEPTAGLTQAEAGRLLSILRENHAETAVILIAHDIDIVFSRCDRIAVLDLGRLIHIGTPEAVRADARVQSAYLGALAIR